MFFHRFDQKLKDAVNMNTKGTLKVLTLAESMKKLEVSIYANGSVVFASNDNELTHKVSLIINLKSTFECAIFLELQKGEYTHAR